MSQDVLVHSVHTSRVGWIFHYFMHSRNEGEYSFGVCMGMFGNCCYKVNLQTIIGANCASREEEPTPWKYFHTSKLFSHRDIIILACIEAWMRIQLLHGKSEIITSMYALHWSQIMSANLGVFQNPFPLIIPPPINGWWFIVCSKLIWNWTQKISRELKASGNLSWSQKAVHQHPQSKKFAKCYIA